MTSPIKPLGDRIVAVKEEAASKTASGLYLPENAKEKTVVAVVESVGPDVKAVKKGDRIVWKDYTTTELKVSGKEFMIVKEEDVLATIA